MLNIINFEIYKLINSKKIFAISITTIIMLSFLFSIMLATTPSEFQVGINKFSEGIYTKLLNYIIIIMAYFSYDLLSIEYNEGTIKNIITTNNSRSMIFIAKIIMLFLNCSIFNIFFISLIYIIYYIFNIVFGVGNLEIQINIVNDFILHYALCIISCFAVCLIFSWLCQIIQKSIIFISTSFGVVGVMILLQMAIPILKSYNIMYYSVPVSYNEILSTTDNILKALLVIAIYIFIFGSISFNSFVKKEIKC